MYRTQSTILTQIPLSTAHFFSAIKSPVTAYLSDSVVSLRRAKQQFTSNRHFEPHTPNGPPSFFLLSYLPGWRRRSPARPHRRAETPFPATTLHLSVACR
ncbi:unnamed protein product [Citrullus colocynthis]|uniref:Uncharacterized protein n=1 Tax=Citrullus colocynthis TaxID=252529 RepID=A0ABP0YMS3_9ROSI